MGKSGALEGADVGFVPSSAAFLCDLGCSLQSGSQIFYFGKGETNVCSSVSAGLLKEPKIKTVHAGRDSVLKSVLYSPHQEELLEAF